MQDIFVNITRDGQLASLPEDESGDGLIPREERTCQKEICRKIWEEKYLPADEVPGYKEDCKSAAEAAIPVTTATTATARDAASAILHGCTRATDRDGTAQRCTTAGGSNV